MVDSITAIQSAPPPGDTPAAQFSARTHHAVDPAFLAEIVQEEITSDLLNIGDSQTTAQINASANDGLLNLNTSTFALLGETGTSPGNLTAQQIQELSILQQDVLGLEEAANATATLPLASGATTVDLSVGAQNIANGVNTVAVAGALNSLTSAQLGQAAAILGPVANQPLTPNLLAQIQSQLTTAGAPPPQLNLNTIFMVLSYVATLQPVSNDAIKAGKIISAETTEKASIAPVSRLDRVAVEDSAILA